MTVGIGPEDLRECIPVSCPTEDGIYAFLKKAAEIAPNFTLIAAIVTAIGVLIALASYKVTRRAHLMARLTEHNKLVADRIEWQFAFFHYAGEKAVTGKACQALAKSENERDIASHILRSGTRGLHLSHVNLVYQAWLMFGHNMEEKWSRLMARVLYEFYYIRVSLFIRKEDTVPANTGKNGGSHVTKVITKVIVNFSSKPSDRVTQTLSCNKCLCRSCNGSDWTEEVLQKKIKINNAIKEMQIVKRLDAFVEDVVKFVSKDKHNDCLPCLQRSIRRELLDKHSVSGEPIKLFPLFVEFEKFANGTWSDESDGASIDIEKAVEFMWGACARQLLGDGRPNYVWYLEGLADLSAIFTKDRSIYNEGFYQWLEDLTKSSIGLSAAVWKIRLLSILRSFKKFFWGH